MISAGWEVASWNLNFCWKFKIAVFPGLESPQPGLCVTVSAEQGGFWSPSSPENAQDPFVANFLLFLPGSKCEFTFLKPNFFILPYFVGILAPSKCEILSKIQTPEGKTSWTHLFLVWFWVWTHQGQLSPQCCPRGLLPGLSMQSGM